MPAPDAPALLLLVPAPVSPSEPPVHPAPPPEPDTHPTCILFRVAFKVKIMMFVSHLVVFGVMALQQEAQTPCMPNTHLPLMGSDSSQALKWLSSPHNAIARWLSAYRHSVHCHPHHRHRHHIRHPMGKYKHITIICLWSPLPNDTHVSLIVCPKTRRTHAGSFVLKEFEWQNFKNLRRHLRRLRLHQCHPDRHWQCLPQCPTTA